MTRPVRWLLWFCAAAAAVLIVGQMT